MNAMVKHNPQIWLKSLCILVLVFIPFNALLTPLLDFQKVEERGVNWTVTLSTFVFIKSLLPLLILLIFLSQKSIKARLLFWSTAVFFIYAFLWTLYSLTDPTYPLFGLITLLATTLVGALFYYSIRNNSLTVKTVANTIMLASIFSIIPLLLVQFNPIKFTDLSVAHGANNILYGYENPRALGWAATISLSLFSGKILFKPKVTRIDMVFLMFGLAAATTLFWSGSRGGLFAFLLSSTVLFVFSAQKHYTNLSYVLLCVMGGGLLSLLLHYPGTSYGLITRVSETVTAQDLKAASSGRSVIWDLSVSYILDRPWTGYGYLPQRNLDAFPSGAGSSSAHNIILDLWLGFGLAVGTAVLLLGCVMWAKAFDFFKSENNHYISILFYVITTLIFYSLVSGPYARTFPTLIFAISIGTLLGARAKAAETGNVDTGYRENYP